MRKRELLQSIILAICVSVQTCVGVNILFFLGVSTYSHREVMWPLVEELVSKGHNITFLQTFENKSPHPKVKDIYADSKAADKFIDINLINMRGKWGKRFMQLMSFQLPLDGVNICEAILKVCYICSVFFYISSLNIKQPSA